MSVFGFSMLLKNGGILQCIQNFFFSFVINIYRAIYKLRKSTERSSAQFLYGFRVKKKICLSILSCFSFVTF